jgi:hypothetical protein
MCCIKIFPYEDVSEWTKQFVFASDDNEEDFTLDEWEEYICTYWFFVTDKGWGLFESLEEAIIEAFDLLGFEYDDADVCRLYGLEEAED